MEHRMRAETEPESDSVKEWHIVRGDETTSMCGRELSASAPEQSADAWGTERSQPFCHSCGALFLREVP